MFCMKHVLVFILVSIIYLYNFGNKLCNIILGKSFRDGSVTKPRYTGRKSAHRQKVLLRSGWAASTGQLKVDKNFALMHTSWEDPEDVILKNNNVTLMSLDCDFAYFAVLPQGTDPYAGAFMYMTQTQMAIEIITISLGNFVNLSHRVPVSNSKVMLLSNTSRCGSTLLTKMLQQLNQVVAISEPYFLAWLALLDKHNLISQPVNDVIRAGFKLMCKEPGKRLWVVKPHSFASGLIPAIAEACPDIRHVIMTRDPKANISSIMTMLNVYNLGPLNSFSSLNKLPLIASALVKDNQRRGLAIEMAEAIVRKGFPEPDLSAFYWAIHALSLQEAKKQLKLDFLEISYEDLTEAPLMVIKKLLSHCEVKQDFTEITKCLDAMEKDSQDKSPLSWNVVRNIKTKKLKLTNDDWAKVERVLQSLGQLNLNSI